MTRFAIEEADFHGHPVLELFDRDCGSRLRVALRGATVLSYRVPDGDRLLDIADGYVDATELETTRHSRFAVMAPFANRIADARYRFAGEERDLQPGVSDGRGIRHGFVRREPFAVDARAANDTAACLTLVYRGLRPGVHPGWPHAVDVSVGYRLHAGGLDMYIEQHNVGDTAAPAFCGWHPYFRVGDDAIDGWQLQVPGRAWVRTDALLLPLDGAAAFGDLDATPALDFRQLRAVGSAPLDVAYTGLAVDADGRSRSVLRHPRSGLTLRVWQEHGVVLVFTGDTLSRGARDSVAVEPMESMSNAYNRDDCRAAVMLAAGARRRFRFGVEVAHT